ncbi:hypothetical protein [Saccharothrix obliqua]|uniref:hypothetical protein n=1 Tax=Saccharothrix obliqua TaxID=2861747 RepID=UPI001C5EAA18|nr:hypothetical protein [Saccharothrix obliqua]MBW4718691.1 hypothetical protein [Saccharothrix obliqua]
MGDHVDDLLCRGFRRINREYRVVALDQAVSGVRVQLGFRPAGGDAGFEAAVRAALVDASDGEVGDVGGGYRLSDNRPVVETMRSRPGDPAEILRRTFYPD